MMKKYLSILITILLVTLRSQAFNSDGFLDVSSFNVQIFGANKISKPLIQDYLTKIVLRYDLILIQEIRDSDETAIRELLDLVRAKDDRYKVVVSARLGRSTSKEQYAYIYRSDWLTAVESFVYNDVDDVFEREPFVVRFKSSKAEVSDFVAIGIHTKPDDAGPEISQLANVYDHCVKTLNIENAILMGDFNAGCSYVKSFKDVKLATDPRFYWLLDNNIDTTTSASNCPYDRFVVAGTEMLNSIIPGSSGIFRFNDFYGLDYDQMKEISDHYPIQFQIKSKYMYDNIEQIKEYENKDKKIDAALKGNYRKVYALRSSAINKGYHVYSTFTSSGAYLNIEVSDVASSRVKAIALLNKMRNDFPELISTYQVFSALEWFTLSNPFKNLAYGEGEFKTLYDFLKTRQYTFTVILSCSLKNRNQPQCFIKVETQPTGPNER